MPNGDWSIARKIIRKNSQLRSPPVPWMTSVHMAMSTAKSALLTAANRGCAATAVRTSWAASA